MDSALPVSFFAIAKSPSKTPGFVCQDRSSKVYQQKIAYKTNTSGDYLTLAARQLRDALLDAEEMYLDTEDE